MTLLSNLKVSLTWEARKNRRKMESTGYSKSLQRWLEVKKCWELISDVVLVKSKIKLKASFWDSVWKGIV